jgi:hypothetical protein
MHSGCLLMVIFKTATTKPLSPKQVWVGLLFIFKTTRSNILK